MKEIKNWRFVIILVLTGICFYNRGQILRYLSELRIPDYIETVILNPAETEEMSKVPETSVANTDIEDSESDASSVNDTLLPEEKYPEVSAQEESTPDEEQETAELKPVWGTVEEDYFNDAVFIGDSRTVGLSDYAGLTNTTFYASTGLTVYKMFDAEIVPAENGNTKITIEEALSERQFKKIYLMIGINEMGTGTVDTFIAKYKEVVAHLQELQPDAIIYVQAIMRVGTRRSEKGDYINNEGIDARNAEIAKLADNEKIFYLDVNPQVTDEDGGLVDDYTFDGVHLLGKYVSIWKQFLLDNAITFQ